MAAYFDTMADELAAYPVTDVELEIVDVITPGSVLNVDEEPSFYVRVTNTGPLRLTGVTVRVRGQNGATVKHGGALAQFASDFVSDELPPINAHGGSVLSPGGAFRFKAPGGAQASKTLVKATLEEWNVDWEKFLTSHSDPLDPPNGTYAAEVLPL